MALEKFSCPSCGASLQLKPGLSRVSCRYCGSAYVLKENRNAPFSSSGASSTDNPADVLLIPHPASVISLKDIYAPKLQFGRPIEETCGRILDVPYPEYEKAFLELDSKIRFLAMVSLLLEENYQLSGRLVLNVVPKYLPYEDRCGSEPLPEDKILQLREPSVVYRHQRNYATGLTPDSLKKYGGHFDLQVSYRSTDAEKNRRTASSNASLLLKPYGFTVSDAEKTTLPGTEIYSKEGFLNNAEKRHGRVWASSYTERTVTLQITPSYAEKLLTDEEKEKLEKIGKHDCLDTLAEGFITMLNSGYERQLELRRSFPVELITEQDRVGLGNVRRSESPYTVAYYDYGSAMDGRSGHTGARVFREFGMSVLKDRSLRLMVSASLLSKILPSCGDGGECRWHITGVDPDLLTGYSKTPVTAVTLSPAASAKAVYDSWI
ncbi:MAG: hypothetical protein IJM50_05610 [Lachnospiraceae bacterium]|nr:hypothetical protein [Lachnospiraceae bacterium]